MLLPVRTLPAQVEPLRLRPDHIGDGGEQRPHLGFPVTGALHRLRVEAQRDIVHEHPSVHHAEIDAMLATVDERVQRPDHVIAVDAEVEREVVPGTGRDAGVGQSGLGGDGRHDRLRAVATCHRQPIGAVRDGGPHQHFEVVARLQLDRLDTAGPSLGRQREPLGLPAARPRIHEQDGLARRRRRGQLDVRAERDPCGGDAGQHADGDDRELSDMPGDQDERETERNRSYRECDDPEDAGAEHRVGGGEQCDDHAGQQDQPVRERLGRHPERQQQGQWCEHQEPDRCESSSHHLGPRLPRA